MENLRWAAILRFFSGIGMNHLVTQDEIRQAKHCLYQVHHVEQGWNPSGPNPSGLRVEDQCFEDDVSADWYGIFRDDKLVGVGRLMGKLETAKYLPREKVDRIVESVNPDGQLRVYENTRTAFVPEVRGGLASACLWAARAYFSGVRGYHFSVGVVVNPKLAKVYEDRFGFRRTGLRKKYDKGDPYETEICFSEVGNVGCSANFSRSHPGRHDNFC